MTIWAFSHTHKKRVYSSTKQMILGPMLCFIKSLFYLLVFKFYTSYVAMQGWDVNGGVKCGCKSLHHIPQRNRYRTKITAAPPPTWVCILALLALRSTSHYQVIILTLQKLLQIQNEYNIFLPIYQILMFKPIYKIKIWRNIYYMRASTP